VDGDYDAAVRAAAIEYVMTIADSNGGVITRDELERFAFQGEQIKLVDPARGIRNPRQLAATLTVMTSPEGPYADEPGEDGLYRYKTRTGEWAAGDNRKLHEAFERGSPMIWLRKLRDRVFIPFAPVFLVGAEPEREQYAMAIGEDLRLVAKGTGLSGIERRWMLTQTRRRLHQPVFRAHVIQAYERRCAICSLRHVELLDAAHIIPDTDPHGEAIVTNGLALCKIHHAAYDNDVVGIDGHRIVHVAPTVLTETDGPMLRYGLQGFHGQPLRALPRAAREQPDPDRLRVRFEEFERRAG
jgi:putative restriction endonuclease